MNLRGASHIHSTYSFDGRLTLNAVHDLFTQRGCDFLLLTEHIEELESSRVSTFVDECRRLSAEGCLLIPGIEIDELHILCFGVSAMPYLPVLEAAHEFRRQGALIVLSHPIKMHHGVPPAVRSMICGVETWNCRYDGKLAPRKTSMELLEQLRLESPGLVATAGIDFHSRSDYAPVVMEVDVPSPSQEYILQEIRSGRHRILREDRVCSPNVLYTVAHDSVKCLYRNAKRAGIKPPPRLRRLAKRLL